MFCCVIFSYKEGKYCMWEGICASKEFVMCVIKTKFPSLSFSTGKPGFVVAAHASITDTSMFSLKSKLVCT